MKIFTLDIGGSSVKYGSIEILDGIPSLTENGFKILASRRFEDLEILVFELIDFALQQYPFSAVAISTTGSVDTNNVVVSAGHFEGYTNISWKNRIAERYMTIKHVYTANDGRASAWSEFMANEKKVSSHIHFVVGTGVGGGLVVDNKLLLGDSGQAGYVGHMKITSDPTIKCSCGKSGCLETLSSSAAIVDNFKRAKSFEVETTYDDVVAEALQGDEDAKVAIETGGYWLGVGIGNCMNVLNPGVVSIGGGVVASAKTLTPTYSNDIYFNSVLKGVEFASHRRVFASSDIRYAQYGNDGGMIGAALLCFATIPDNR